jgi:hypothetical protein
MLSDTFVIVREDGMYVACPGSEQSYTARFEKAQLFNSRKEAEKNLCPEN